MITGRERELVHAARYALRYFRHETYGENDEITIGRELTRTLAAYHDIDAVHDADRRAQADGFTERI